MMRNIEVLFSTRDKPSQSCRFRTIIETGIDRIRQNVVNRVWIVCCGSSFCLRSCNYLVDCSDML